MARSAGGEGLSPRLAAWRRSLSLLLFLLTALVAAPQGAGAHAALDESTPANGEILATAPESVTLRFTEPLERSSSTASLADQTGAAVTGVTLEPGADDYAMTLMLTPGLPNGT